MEFIIFRIQSFDLNMTRRETKGVIMFRHISWVLEVGIIKSGTFTSVTEARERSLRYCARDKTQHLITWNRFMQHEMLNCTWNYRSLAETRENLHWNIAQQNIISSEKILVFLLLCIAKQDKKRRKIKKEEILRWYQSGMHTDNKTTADWDPMTILKIELFSPSICEFSPQLQRSPTKVVSRFQVSKVFTRDQNLLLRVKTVSLQNFHKKLLKMGCNKNVCCTCTILRNYISLARTETSILPYYRTKIISFKACSF